MRPLAIVPFVLSIIAFSLILVNILAGSNLGMLEDYPILTLNLSSVGQNAITFTPANPAATTRRSAVAADSEPGGIRAGKRAATRIGGEKGTWRRVPSLFTVLAMIRFTNVDSYSFGIEHPSKRIVHTTKHVRQYNWINRRLATRQRGRNESANSGRPTVEAILQLLRKDCMRRKLYTFCIRAESEEDLCCMRGH